MHRAILAKIVTLSLFNPFIPPKYEIIPPMGQITIFAIPYSGHVNPTLDLTSQLVKAGHSVEYWATPAVEAKIAKTGATFRSYPDTVIFPSGAENLFALTTALATAAGQLHEYLSNQLAKNKPDLILTDSSTVWGKYLGEEFDIPVITLFPNVVVTPQVLLNRRSTRLKSLYDGIRYVPDLVTAIQAASAYTTAFHPSKQGQPFDVLACHSSTNLVFTSQAFQPHGHRLDDSYHFVGPQLNPDFFLGKKAKHSEPLSIYVSLGTLYNNNLRFYSNCIEALISLPATITISAGSPETADHLQKLAHSYQSQAHFSIAPRVDQLAVLKTSDLFITHGGMNSVSESTAAQVPMLVVPQTIEQSINGSRVSQLGMGEYLHNSFASSATIFRKVSKMISHLDTYQPALSNISHSFQNAGGTAAALSIISEVISS